MDESPEPPTETEHNDEDWSQHAEADDSQRIPSSLRIEAHIEASRPSSSSNNVGEDVDGWNGQTDADKMHRLPSSLIVEDDIDDMDVSANPSINESSSDAIGAASRLPIDILDGDRIPSAGLAPQRAEPTLKEKLVERERQRRVETERARLKRQFALSSNGGGSVDEDGHAHSDGAALREYGSVAGTIGEGSTVAVADIEEEEDTKLTYPMKRFLEEQGGIIEEEPRESPREGSQGVVMERFLKEPVVVDSENEQEAPAGLRTSVDRSVSFDMDASSPTAIAGDATQVTSATLAEIPVSGAQLPEFLDTTSAVVGASAAASVANASVTCLPPGEEETGTRDLEVSVLDDMEGRAASLVEIQSIPESPQMDRSTSSDQPPFLHLTAAQIQEMAAIDEASRSNAPPSDRDSISDSSFVGELVSDFGGHGVDNIGTLSQGTPTTAMESASIGSGNHSARPMSEDIDDRNSIDELANVSISSHAVVSSTGGNVSVAANPPSDIGGDEVVPSLIQEDIQPGLEPNNGTLTEASITIDVPRPAVSEIILPKAQTTNSEASDPMDMQLPGEDCKIVNRMIRPGMTNLDRTSLPEVLAPSTPIRRSLSAPNNMNFEVDGFDFDKNAPGSPEASPFGAIRVGADDMWSPGSRMSASPYPAEKSRNYGSTNNTDAARKHDVQYIHHTTLLRPRAMYNGETEPLMPEIPKEIVASSEYLESKKAESKAVPSRDFSGKNAGTTPPINEDFKLYQESSVLHRAFSGRVITLLVTCLVEIPVLLMIVGGSDRLCALVGRQKLQLLVGFLPLCSALSGNVGLQSCDLTTRAISHGHVNRDTFATWLAKEVGASACLGLCVGLCVGVAALTMTSFDLPFGLTIMIAQFISIAVAGVSGTLAPAIFTILSKPVPEKWIGPLETAFQDIVGAFTIIILSYNVLVVFSPYYIEPSDTCAEQT